MKISALLMRVCVLGVMGFTEGCSSKAECGWNSILPESPGSLHILKAITKSSTGMIAYDTTLSIPTNQNKALFFYHWAMWVHVHKIREITGRKSHMIQQSDQQWNLLTVESMQAQREVQVISRHLYFFTRRILKKKRNNKKIMATTKSFKWKNSLAGIVGFTIPPFSVLE